MLELLIISSCINIALAFYVYNKREIIDMYEDALYDNTNKIVDLTNKLNTANSRRKYSSHRKWFADNFRDQDFDDIIDMLLFQYIDNYTNGDTIEYPTIETDFMSNEEFDDASTYAEVADTYNSDFLNDYEPAKEDAEELKPSFKEAHRTNDRLDNIEPIRVEETTNTRLDNIEVERSYSSSNNSYSDSSDSSDSSYD